MANLNRFERVSGDEIYAVAPRLALVWRMFLGFRSKTRSTPGYPIPSLRDFGLTRLPYHAAMGLRDFGLTGFLNRIVPALRDF